MRIGQLHNSFISASPHESRKFKIPRLDHCKQSKNELCTCTIHAHNDIFLSALIFCLQRYQHCLKLNNPKIVSLEELSLAAKHIHDYTYIYILLAFLLSAPSVEAGPKSPKKKRLDSCKHLSI